MQIRFDDRVVLVTGASSGIGAAIARGFGAAGATVAVHYNATEDGARAVVEDIEGDGGKAAVFQADVLDRAQVRGLVEAVLDRFGRIDVLVNNAGDLVGRHPIGEASDEFYDEIMELNIGSVFQACSAVVPHLRERGSGNIITITSIAARNGGGNGSTLYCTSKGAVSAFTRGLAKELAPVGIRVNAISPGVIATRFQERHTAEEAFAGMVGQIPLGRPGRPEEIVGAALFLASEEMASFVTGHVLEVNGGHLMG